MNALSASNNATAYGLHSHTFEGLFNHTDQIARGLALEELALTARAGNLNSLELLVDLARDGTQSGAEAESILFDLFSRPEPGSEHLAQEVAQLAAMARPFIKPHDQADRLHPANGCSKLLYMAGAQESPAQRKTLTAQFSAALDLGREQDLWSNGRYITDMELDADLERLKSELEEQHLPTEGFGLTTSIDAYQPNTKPEWRFTPVLVDQHFVLMCDRTEPGQPPETVVFSSKALNDVEQSLICLKRPEAKLIQAPLQTFVPNGCALFVRAAREYLAFHPDTKMNLEHVLHDWTNAMRQLPDRELAAFNLNGRRQMMGQLLDTTARADKNDRVGIDENEASSAADMEMERNAQSLASGRGAVHSDISFTRVYNGHENLQSRLRKDAALKECEQVLLKGDSSAISDAIPHMVNAAMADDDWGKLTEAMLFKNFSTPPRGRPALPGMIAQGVLKSLANEDPPPVGKLLYMAGSQLKDGPREAISQQFFEALNLDRGLNQRGDDFYKDIWHPDRDISKDELNAHMATWEKTNPSERIRAACEFADYNAPRLTKDWQVTPIDLGGEWVLALERLAEGPANRKETRIFSTKPLTKVDQEFLRVMNLTDPDPIIGTPKTALTHTSGVVVNDVLKNLVFYPQKDPISLLNDQAERLPTEDGFESFNQSRRHEMMGALIDSKLAPTTSNSRTF